MIMKRIKAAIEKKLDALKGERSVKRIFRIIDTAKDNALDEIDKLETEKAELVENLPETKDYESFVQRLSELMDAQEEQKAVIKRLEEVKAYLDEDIEVTEK